MTTEAVTGKVWKTGESCVWHGWFGIVRLVERRSAYVEFDGHNA